MKIVSNPRCSGKTTELIKISAESWAHLVVLSQANAGEIFHQARDMGFDIPFPITFDDFINGDYYEKGIRGFVVDNVDLLIQRMSRGVPVLAISATKEAADE